MNRREMMKLMAAMPVVPYVAPATLKQRTKLCPATKKKIWGTDAEGSIILSRQITYKEVPEWCPLRIGAGAAGTKIVGIMDTTGNVMKIINFNGPLVWCQTCPHAVWNFEKELEKDETK